MSSRRRAGVWRLVVLIPLAGALFLVEESVTASAQAHAIMQVAIFLVTIWLMSLWVRSDERAATRQAVSRLVVLDILEPENVKAPVPRERTPPVRHVKLPVSD